MRLAPFLGSFSSFYQPGRPPPAYQLDKRCSPCNVKTKLHFLCNRPRERVRHKERWNRTGGGGTAARDCQGGEHTWALPVRLQTPGRGGAEKQLAARGATDWPRPRP